MQSRLSSVPESSRATLLRGTHRYMLVLAACFAAGILVFMPENRVRGLVLFAAVSLVCLVSRLLLNAGRVRAACLSFLVLLGVVVTLLVWTGGGERAVAISGYMCIVLTAGLMFGLRGGLLASLLCLMVQAAVAYLTSTGQLPPSRLQHSTTSLLVAQGVFSIWVAILVFHYTRAISSVNHDLAERVKELTTLHRASETLQRGSSDMRETLADLAKLLPAAYQFSGAAAARVRLGGDEAATPDFEAGAPRQTSEFETSDGTRGTIEVAYVRAIPLKKGEATFLREEQDLIDTLADMLRSTYERSAANAALRESEAHLRELFETARDTIYQLSTDGVILSLNPAFEKVTGWKREEWLGERFTGLVHPDDLIKTLESYQSTLAGRETPLYEIRIRTKDDGYVNSEILAVPRIQNGATIGVLGIARDLTERRRLEDQIQRSQRVQSIGALASGIAHDLNNVLTPITLSGGLLERHMENEQARRMLGMILSAARRGGEIVKQILNFARGNAGISAPQDLRPLAREMETFMRQTFPRNIDIHFDIPLDLPRVLGDPTQIHQVLLNLCVNARDAMPEGGRLSVSVHSETMTPTEVEVPHKPGAEGYVVLTVTDTGAGIPPEIQSRIYDPFFTTKQLGEGTGLGLSTTQSIVRAHGGFIRLISSPSSGTEFRIYLPAAKTSEGETGVNPIPFAKGNGDLVLVVDDEKSILFFIREILELQGYSVHTASNGIEALALYAGESPGAISLVISDIDMPVMNGLDFQKNLRQIAPSVPLLLISGSVTSWTPEPHEAGITRFLEKPFTTADLLNRIGTLRIG
jgi:two-component system cell cycle sensor histidine kinase/response regulator CckA